MNKNIRLLIFDWDGTLVNSLARIVEAVQVAAQHCQIPPRSAEQIHAIIGLSLLEAFGVLYPDIDDESLREQFRQSYAEHYLSLEQEPSAFYPGVRDALDDYKAAGYQLAVATGKSRRGLDHILQGHQLEDFFHITRCADETKGKPHPLMLQQILQHCQQPPEHAIVVGDSPFDLQMANNAQIAGVAVSYGAQPLEVLMVEKPILAIDNFSELSNWLAQTP